MNAERRYELLKMMAKVRGGSYQGLPKPLLPPSYNFRKSPAAFQSFRLITSTRRQDFDSFDVKLLCQSSYWSPFPLESRRPSWGPLRGIAYYEFPDRGFKLIHFPEL